MITMVTTWRWDEAIPCNEYNLEVIWVHTEQEWLVDDEEHICLTTLFVPTIRIILYQERYCTYT